MIDMMEYKGYLGSVHYSDEDECFYGKIEHIRDLISYEGQDVASIKKSFEDSVEDYLKTCKVKIRLLTNHLRDPLMFGQARSCIDWPIFMLKRKKRTSTM